MNKFNIYNVTIAALSLIIKTEQTNETSRLCPEVVFIRNNT